VEVADESAWDLSPSLGALSARARLRTEMQSVIGVILFFTHGWSFSEKSAPDGRLIPRTTFSASKDRVAAATGPSPAATGPRRPGKGRERATFPGRCGSGLAG
jgi:hypothetical protein